MISIVAHQVVVPAADYVYVTSRLVNDLPAIKRLRKWAWIAIAVSSIGISLNLWERGSNATSNMAFFGALLIISGYYVFFSKSMLNKRLLKTYLKENIPAKYPTDYTFTADIISGHSDLNSFSARWATIQRAEVINHWLLLYPTERSCYWVDLKKLQAPATSADLEHLLTAHSIQTKAITT